MDKINSKTLGKIVMWKDYVRFFTRPDGETEFRQSNTKLEKYTERNIGVALADKNTLMVAVAVSNNDNKRESDRTAKNVIEQRLAKIISKEMNIDPEDKGVTYVPRELYDYLWNDPYTYKNLYGAMEPTYLGIAVRMLKSE